MSDKQTTMSNDTLEKIVCLRTGNSRTAVTVLKTRRIDVTVDSDEAKHVAHDFSTLW
jgi:hypothetical protein